MEKSQGKKRQGAKLYKESDTIYIKFDTYKNMYLWIYAFAVKI